MFFYVVFERFKGNSVIYLAVLRPIQVEVRPPNWEIDRTKGLFSVSYIYIGEISIGG